MIKINRPEITEQDFAEVLKVVEQEWEKELRNKGKGIFVNSHEDLGCLEEEYQELKGEIHNNDIIRTEDEILDMIVILVHELASIRRREQ